MPRSLNLLWNKVNIYSYHVSEILCTSRVKKIYLPVWINILRDFYGRFHHFFRAALLSIGLLYFYLACKWFAIASTFYPSKCTSSRRLVSKSSIVITSSMSKLILHAIVTTTRSQLTNKVWDVNEIWSLQHDFMLNNLSLWNKFVQFGLVCWY